MTCFVYPFDGALSGAAPMSLDESQPCSGCSFPTLSVFPSSLAPHVVYTANSLQSKWEPIFMAGRSLNKPREEWAWARLPLKPVQHSLWLLPQREVPSIPTLLGFVI